MGLFRDLFGKNINKIEYEENHSEHWADSITTGWEYTCSLFLTTPKICLENDGLIISDTSKAPELFGEPNQLGKDGDPTGKYGSWVRRYGYEEAFEELANISEDMIYAKSSEIGKIPSRSKLERDFKRFLIGFRTIVESKLNFSDKLYEINEVLSISSRSNSEIYKKLVKEKKFPDDFFKKELCLLNGVDLYLAEIFWDLGYHTPEQILNAPDSELLNINSIDEKFIKNLRVNV